MIKKNKSKKKYIQIRINNQIRYKEVRVLNEDGSNLGVMSSDKALESAQKLNLDLIEISGRSVPPLVKIADYGKFLYEQKKKQKELKAKQKISETKNIQVKVGTGEGDLLLKAKNISK
ncbi:MAG: translation initiation factor IF-3 [Candidatus Pacebacteria bacterium]|nr:translation initiation factor IF-3 [Candidatus Paceibacterota bacterium]